MQSRGVQKYVHLILAFWLGFTVHILYSHYNGSLKIEYAKSSSTIVSGTSQRDSRDMSRRDSLEPVTHRERHDLLLTYIPKGRLGNHMFQYAGLLGIAGMNNREPFISHPNNLHLLTKAFNLSYVKPGINSTDWKRIHENNYAIYESKFESLPNENISIVGYLQSFKYFEKYQNMIRNEFKFIDTVNSEADLIFNRACNTSEFITVGLHVRRGDIMNAFGIITPSKLFYNNAMEWMRTKHGRVKFLLATDDTSWAKENLKGSDIVLLPNASSEVHMATLSKCRHMIMSIGTFGWWAAFLTGGDVIYFKYPLIPGSLRYKRFSINDHFFPHWIGLDDVL